MKNNKQIYKHGNFASENTSELQDIIIWFWLQIMIDIARMYNTGVFTKYRSSYLYSKQNIILLYKNTFCEQTFKLTLIEHMPFMEARDSYRQ